MEAGGLAEGEHSARPSVSSISSILNQSADDSDSGFHGFQSRDDPSQTSNNNSSPNSINTVSFPNLTNNGLENGVAGIHNSQDANNCHHGVPPMMNGWIQQSAHYSQPCTSAHYQQQPTYNLNQITSGVMPMQCLPYQHQALMHQRSAHQYVVAPSAAIQRNKYPGQQQQQLPASNSVQHVTMQPSSRNFGQPVYANAPPKPRRLTDGSYSAATPSPDVEYVKSPISPDYRPIAKSPISEYERSGSSLYETKVTKPPKQQPTRGQKALVRTDRSGLNYGFAQPTERRTPDTYGRSANSTINRANGDYEDVYNPPQLYQRPNGPVTTAKHWSDQQFARSASARIPRSRHPAAIDRETGDFMESTISHDSRDGERKIQQVPYNYTF